MLQPTRRFLAATSVAAALLLTAPAPSWAAQVHKPAQAHSLGLWAQAWSWLEGLLGRQPEVQRKDSVGASQPSPAPLPQPPYEGPMIDPDGAKK